MFFAVNMSACVADIDEVVLFLFVVQQCRNWGNGKSLVAFSGSVANHKKTAYLKKRETNSENVC